jgi:response regulator of citrate/malate metabolism
MRAAVFVATSPREAIELFRQNAHEVHLVLLDIYMIDFPRTSLLPDLHLIQPDRVLIAMAIDPTYRVEKKLLRQGVGRILPKPPRVQEFAETVWDLARAIEHTSVGA